MADHAPSVKSVGITGQLAGSRANVIVADDIEVPNNSATPGMRDKLADQVKEFDAILKPGGKVLFLGTPQSEESVYNKLSERGYVQRIWPARYPSVKTIETKYGDRIAPLIRMAVEGDQKLEGRSTEPLRFCEDDLHEREASYGRSGFALRGRAYDPRKDRPGLQSKLRGR